MAMTPTHEAYDAVVAGSGIGGMLTAALLSAAGRRVLVAEAQGAPGGYVHSFQRGPYTLDPAAHLVVDPPMFSRLLEHLGVRDEVTFLDPGDFFSVSLPGLQMHAPLGLEPFIESFEAALPEQAEQIRAFWEAAAQIHRDAHELPSRAGLGSLDDINERFPTLMRYRKSTIEQVMDELLPDPRARALCGAVSLYLGLPPSKLAFIAFSQMVFSHVVNGAAYIEGGLQQLINALVLAVERAGGEVLCSTAVERIVVEDGRVVGAELAGGAHVTAPIVVSNADPFKTFGPMLGDDAPVGYLRRMHRMRPSISGYLLFGATGLDVERAGAGHVNFHYDSWDIEDAYRRTLAGEAAALTVSVPTLVDPTLAPEGEHVLVAAAPMRYDTDADWGAVKASMTPRIVDRLDALAPGLGESLTFSEPATPLTLERFSGNQGGAMYGWDYAADHKSSLRPDTVTPVNGLYLAGQWTSLGGGFVRSALSGTIAAERILARDGVELPRFMSDVPATATS
ncbi:phytoene desaturase family protein [Solirubrobacter ginsenosidimutans]|nr:NAD(P)/FAD-dependent oxidoreductase [Solirubrobacter ginsenosidimutans]